MKFFTSTYIVLFLILGCVSIHQLKLDGTKWALVQYQDSSGSSVAVTYLHGKAEHGYWVEFRGDTIFGKDNCNSFSGSYVMNKNDITISDLISTLIGCPETLEFIPALQAAESINRRNSTLIVRTKHPKLTILTLEQIL